MGKKVFTSTKHGALETPINSFDLAVETSYDLYAGRDSKLYSCRSIKESSEKNCYSIEAPMKKLISEEISKRSNARTNAPSIVARLMGVDLGQAPLMAGKKNATPVAKFSDKERPKKGSVGHDLYMENSSPQWDVRPFDDYSDSHMKLGKPKPREHPQEEQLQKFKKEFEAWQAARFSECSKVLEQDELKQTNFHNADSRRMKIGGNLMESHNKKKDYLLDGAKVSFYSDRRSRKDIQPSKLMSAEQKSEVVDAPTKIVILRPGPDRLGVSEDSWNTSPSMVNEKGSIIDFLEEVKERLNSDLQGTSSRKSTTFYREKPSEPRQIAQRIAKQVRDSVTRDIGMNLLRSESTRSYRSDNGTCSPEFITKDSRRLLTERLRNVQEVPTVSHQRARSSVSDQEKSKVEENQSRSFRQDFDDGRIRFKKPSNGGIVKFLSAPVSGTSFGKLLLEDPYILTGAQIRMKHEVVENDVKRQKDKFNIREKFSSFGYSLTLRGRLFRRRVQSVDELHYDRDDLFNDIASGPTVMMSSHETHENYTEVPPSPASVCSSVCDELWKPASFTTSPTSSGVNQQEDSEIPDAFSQVNLNLNDLGRELNQLESTGLVEPKIEEDIDDPTKAYIRDLLFTSGYYDGSCNRSSWPKHDPIDKHISNQVFEQVEESYRQRSKDHENCKKDGTNDRILILDLLNEALPSLLRHPENMSRSGRVVWSVHKPLKGRDILSRIWDIVKVFVHPADDGSCYGLDRMLMQDLKSDPESRLMDDELSALGKDLECHIIGDLVEEIIKDMHLLA